MDAKNKVTVKRDPSDKWQPLKPGTTFTKRERDNRYLAKKRQEKIQAGTLMPHGGQQGNTNGFRHGAYSLLAMRTKGGKPKGNTALGRAFRAREREYSQDMGGEDRASLAKRQLANHST